MRTNLFSIPVIILFITVFGIPEDIPVTASSSMLMDYWTKRPIYSKNAHRKLAPASTTKIMTAIVVLKHASLKDRVIVTRFASLMEPSKLHIKEGEEYLVEDLLKGALLNSGNDASVALAEHIAGSEKNFAKMMTDMAKRIGAKNTNFMNSNGLPAKGQYTTAYDLCLIVRKAMKNKKIVEIMKMKEGEIYELKTKRSIKLKNHNKSLWKKSGYLIVGKTGYTRNAGHCFAGYIEYSRWRKLVVVMLKGRKLWSDLELLAEAPRKK